MPVANRLAPNDPRSPEATKPHHWGTRAASTRRDSPGTGNGRWRGARERSTVVHRPAGEARVLRDSRRWVNRPTENERDKPPVRGEPIRPGAPQTSSDRPMG